MVPADKDKKALLAAVKATVGQAEVIDEVTVKNGATGPDASALAALAGGLTAHPGAKAAWDGTGLTLTGQVPAEQIKGALGSGALVAWLIATLVLPHENKLEEETGTDAKGVFG